MPRVKQPARGASPQQSDTLPPVRLHLRRAAVAASLLWLALVATAWALSHADPAAWRVVPWQGRYERSDFLKSIGMRKDPATGGMSEAFIPTAQPPDPPWSAWFAENRSGRVEVIGQWFEPGDIDVIYTNEVPDRVEVIPDVRSPRWPNMTVRVSVERTISSNQSTRMVRDVVDDPGRWWEQIGVAWQSVDHRSTPVAVNVWGTSGPFYAGIRSTGGPQPTAVQAMLPHWLLLLIGFPLPAIAYSRWHRTRGRRRRGECLACGYDRRATPAANPCPECGTVPPTAAA